MRPLDLDLIKEEIMKSGPETEIMIGCDSQRSRKNGQFYATYAKVVVLHLDGKNGCMVFGEICKEKDHGNLKQRLLNEVGYATSLAYELVDDLDGRKMSIHLDLNPSPNHKSNIAVKEAVGWVRGMFGFDPVIKPHSVAACTCADHFVRI